MSLFVEGKEIVEKVKFADTFFKRFIGLMFKRNIDCALVFVLPIESRINAALHSMFMFEPIDVLFLDSKKEVVDTTTLFPWRFYMPKRKAKYVVEMPQGIIEKFNIRIGQKVDWDKHL